MQPKPSPRAAAKAQSRARAKTAVGGKVRSSRSKAPTGGSTSTAEMLSGVIDEMRQLRLLVLSQGRMLEHLLHSGKTTGAAAPTIQAGAEPASRAAQAIATLNKRLRVPADAAGGQALARELAQGAEAAKAQWVHEGRLVGSKELGAAWGRTRQALEQACSRADLVGLKFACRRWYPTVFTGLDAGEVATVCRLLVTVEPVDQVIFWWRKHGSLGGDTIAEALRSRQLRAVLGTTEAFAQSHRATQC